MNGLTLCITLSLSFLPASTQCLVELHDAEHFTQPDLRKSELSLEEIPVGIQRIQQRVYAPAVSDVGKPLPVRQRGHQQLLLHAAFPDPLMSDERIGDICECRLNRLLVLDQRALALCLCQFHVRLETTSSEDRLRDLRSKSPHPAWCAEQA